MVKIVLDWIDAGTIERPQEYMGWVAAVFPIPKKNGTFRGISDHRGLNERVQKDNYPLPLIENILEKRGRCTMFSKLDLKDAFSQVPISEDFSASNNYQYPPWEFSMASFATGVLQ